MTHEALTRVPRETRFPLNLAVTIPAIDRLYEESKRDIWAPATDVDWASGELAAVTEAQLQAARQVWSRRAWLEYTGIAETPALLLRFCLERGREVDAKYFLTVRNTEEAQLVDVFHGYAELLGGYLVRPVDPAWEAVINRRCHSDALNPEVPLDAYVAAHCALEDGLELELFRAYLANAREPLARKLLARSVADKTRHAGFGWSYLEWRADSLSPSARSEVLLALVDWLCKVAFSGYHVPSLATVIDSAPEQRAQEMTAAAGLGAATATQEEQLFRDYLATARRRLQALGIELPAVSHRRLGPL
ncbi:MAG: hypothetical protein D4R84_01180 [Rhodocyclaceae bacterium]|nr:MAG: hypothetical protein D4R84_01180 [Rhodocyclaceae bacterium]